MIKEQKHFTGRLKHKMGMIFNTNGKNTNKHLRRANDQQYTAV